MELPSFILTLKGNPVHIFLFLDTPPMDVFAGVFIIANHKGAVVLYCYTSFAGHSKVFQ